MNKQVKKALKISGVILLVTVFLFLGIYLIIKSLNKEKIYIDAFDTEFYSEVEKKLNVFDADENADEIEFNNEVALITSTTSSLNLKFENLKTYFASVGLNYQQRKDVDEIIKNITNYSTDLNSCYNTLKSYYENSTTTESQTAIKNAFYETFLNIYSNLLKEKQSLTSYLNNILIEHDITFSSYITTTYSNLDMAVDIAININLNTLINNQSADYSLSNTVEFLNFINENLTKYNNLSLNLNNENHIEILNNFITATQNFTTKFQSFKTAFNNLSNEQLKQLQNNATNYAITTTDSNLVIVINFLKPNGHYETACTISNLNNIACGLCLSTTIE